MTMQESPFEKWARTYRAFAEQGTELMWPSETLVRLFKGDYVSGLDRCYSGKSVLDVGFGSGNNLILEADLGLSLHGTEVDESICTAVLKKLQSLGHDADLRVGTNQNIPFEDNEFDFLVSWNVIHYEDSEEDILSAIAEYHRVLKPGGRLFVSTTGPDHKILKDSKTLAPHRHLIRRDDDFRKGQVFYYFDTAEFAHQCFSTQFSNVSVGRTHDCLMTETLDWFIVSAVKE